MDFNIRTTLDALKRQSVFAVTSNIDFTFEYIKQDIFTYVSEGNGSFSSLLRIADFDSSIISSAQTNAVYLLSYLDFYALYTILYASYGSYESLRDASNNKYLYILSLYKDIITLIKSKETLATSSDVLYLSSLNVKGVDYERSMTSSRNTNTSSVLGSKEVITLPVLNSKRIRPSSIICSDNDMSVHGIENNSSPGIVDYTIKRKQMKKVGIPSFILPASSSTSYSMDPKITGTIYGYFSDKIYVSVSAIDSNGVYIRCSTSGEFWSTEYLIELGAKSPIVIEDNIDTGLTITLYENEGLAVNDEWIISIGSITIGDPTLLAKLRFGILDQISYVVMSDYSKNPLELIDIKYKKTKYDAAVQAKSPYSNYIATIIPVHDQANEVVLSVRQPEAEFETTDGRLTYDYEFKLFNIEGVINEYADNGSMSLDSKQVDSAYNISVTCSEYLEPFVEYPKSFVEHSIFATNKLDSIRIPMLMSETDDIIYEYVIPSSISADGVAKYTTRLPMDQSMQPVAYNLHSGEIAAIASVTGNEIEISNYDRQYGYAVKYKVKQYTSIDALTNTSSDIKWNKNGNIYFMYYRDIDGKNRIAIRTKGNDDSLMPFSGNLTGNIEMRSIDVPYISPMIFEYKLIIR